MNPLDIIKEFYPPGSQAYDVLLTHSEAVAGKAVHIAENVLNLHPDMRFIEEAAMLHDIGVFYTDARSIGCRGSHPYVCHGYLGRRLMEDMGYHRHALVCERHVGAGLSVDEIRELKLPLPVRNMIPITIEEQIVCYADKFFSKKLDRPVEELRVEAVVKKIRTYEAAQAKRFEAWVALFEKDGRSELAPEKPE